MTMIRFNNSNNNMNHNIQNNVFINLPHILLSKIIDVLEENIDRICLTLTCKRLFNEKDKYFRLNSDDIPDQPIHNDRLLSNFKLNTYVNDMRLALQQPRVNCTLMITFGSPSIPPSIEKEYHYLQDYEDGNKKHLDNIDIVTSICRITFHGKNKRALTNEFLNALANSNVNTLHIGDVLKFEFNRLPANIKHIKSNKCFIVNHLPVGLINLSIESLDHPLVTSLLPSTLRSLALENTTQPSLCKIDLKGLPPTLEELRLGQNIEANTAPLPSTLQSLSLQCKIWRDLKSSNNLSNISIKKLELHVNDTNQSDWFIPESVTDLTINLSVPITITKSIFPSGIKKLKFYSYDDRFKCEPDVFSTLHQLEELDLLNVSWSEGLTIGQLPKSIKRILPPRDLKCELSTFCEIPDFSVETLFISIRDIEGGKSPRVPKGVKELIIDSYIQLKPGIVPDGVEELVLTNHQKIESPLESIPASKMSDLKENNNNNDTSSSSNIKLESDSSNINIDSAASSSSNDSNQAKIKENENNNNNNNSSNDYQGISKRLLNNLECLTIKKDDSDVQVECKLQYSVYRGEEDIESIIRLIENELSEPYSIFTYRFFLNNWPHLCFLTHDVTNPEEKRLVGVIISKKSQHKLLERGYIGMVVVDRTYRRMGIGSSLIKITIEKLIELQCDEVVLETIITNFQAISLYENLGFIRLKRLYRYYTMGADAIRLLLPLNDKFLIK
ncbi:hypothetical protein PPL_08212 [Heterostelium album PN500]|uniref:N-acetyltransferase domain-containing protein n=1 Tax=Heterostelium pallidum (strain ATCC 26659 / Pp 5 / PN500) TaxID=670386 RepID=D3BIX7_HETP5|nr:hypothetical protein PPL_08212 [Heterostelium album PN500]EFA78751.1 hypothetical protein PPL_08212 [Heterostelium album PN500]|eukprot:XP_020430875.1 hypothetical protein PPL_08212 [Heterostelium album PN500]